MIEGDPQAFVGARTGCLIGKDLAVRYGWKLGSRVPVTPTIFQRADGGAWEFDVVGIYRSRSSNVDDQTLFFHYAYLQEALEQGAATGPQGVGVFMVDLQPGADHVDVARRIADRMSEALERPGFSRVLVKVREGADIEAMARRLDQDKQVPCKAMTERAYLAAQTTYLSATLLFLGGLLALIMGAAAVFTGTNTMLAALAARTHEVGILLALGFRPFPIFLSFLLESTLIGLMGGLVGCLMTLPLDGLRTGTTNFNTFTEIAFAFRITPTVLVTAVSFALALGVLGGTVPALLAARLRPTQALRRE